MIAVGISVENCHIMCLNLDHSCRMLEETLCNQECLNQMWDCECGLLLAMCLNFKWDSFRINLLACRCSCEVQDDGFLLKYK